MKKTDVEFFLERKVDNIELDVFMILSDAVNSTSKHYNRDLNDDHQKSLERLEEEGYLSLNHPSTTITLHPELLQFLEVFNDEIQ